MIFGLYTKEEYMKLLNDLDQTSKKMNKYMNLYGECYKEFEKVKKKN